MEIGDVEPLFNLLVRLKIKRLGHFKAVLRKMNIKENFLKRLAQRRTDFAPFKLNISALIVA